MFLPLFADSSRCNGRPVCVPQQPPARRRSGQHRDPGTAERRQVRVAPETRGLCQDLAQSLVCSARGSAPVLQGRGGDQSPGKTVDTLKSQKITTASLTIDFRLQSVGSLFGSADLRRLILSSWSDQRWMLQVEIFWIYLDPVLCASQGSRYWSGELIWIKSLGCWRAETQELSHMWTHSSLWSPAADKKECFLRIASIKN